MLASSDSGRHSQSRDPQGLGPKAARAADEVGIAQTQPFKEAGQDLTNTADSPAPLVSLFNSEGRN